MLDDLRRAPFSGRGLVPRGVGAPGKGAKDDVGQNRNGGHGSPWRWLSIDGTPANRANSLARATTGVPDRTEDTRRPARSENIRSASRAAALSVRIESAHRLRAAQASSESIRTSAPLGGIDTFTARIVSAGRRWVVEEDRSQPHAIPTTLDTTAHNALAWSALTRGF